MIELKMSGMKSDAGNPALRCFGGMVLAVADDRVSDGRELHSYLILQARDQRDAQQRGRTQALFHGISQFGAGRFGVAGWRQFLKHALAAKIMNKRVFRAGEMPAHDGEIPPDRSVAEKLTNERITVGLGLGKEHDARGEAIDAMHDEGALPPRPQRRREQ